MEIKLGDLVTSVYARDRIYVVVRVQPYPRIDIELLGPRTLYKDLSAKNFVPTFATFGGPVMREGW